MIACPHCQTQNADNSRFCAECGKQLGSPARTVALSELGGLQTIEPGDATDSGNKPSGNDAGHFPPGHVFAGRYEIRQLLGEGWMGVVYRAHDTVADRDVALKLIRAERLAGKDAAKRLVREGVLARDIRHPNVVAIYDAGEIDGATFISMEMLPGTTLRMWNRQRMLSGVDCSLGTARNIVTEILSGLAAAHAAGVIHRNLKPENVILLDEPSDAGARLKILDFGIARGSGSDTGSTAMAAAPYLAPELIVAPEAAQPSADLFSLSVMFYELLVGVVPQGHWQPPSGGRSDVPPAIDKLIERGFANNPRARPQSAEEYRAALDDALKLATPQPVKPQPAPPRPQPPKPEPVKPDPMKPGPVVNDVIDGPKPPPGPPPAPTQPNKLSPVRIALFAGVGVIGLLIVIAGVVQMSGGPKQDEEYSNNDDYIPPTPSPPPSPPPPPAEPDYASFGGYWTDDFQNTLQVQVSSGGTVVGQAISGPLYGYSLAGQFNGSNFAFQIGNAYGVAGGSTGKYDGGCHIRYTTTDAYGNATGSAQLHINHQPGAPCP